MNEKDLEHAWFYQTNPEDTLSGAIAIEEGSCISPLPWPSMALEHGYATTPDEYYSRLYNSACEAAQKSALNLTQTPDRQISHAIRTMDDYSRIENELTARLSEWMGDYTGISQDLQTSIESIATNSNHSHFDAHILSLHNQLISLSDKREKLAHFIESEMPNIAPNLTQMAGPLLAARLISIAGSLEKLAKKPSGTLQVLGAENALFAHLRGRATSPKHGVIYTHEYISKTHPSLRGNIARAFSGKLSIAARIDYYSGTLNPELHSELLTKIDQIRSRGGSK